jgi:hypothetical protein
MKVLFVAGFGPIAADVKASRRLYRDADSHALDPQLIGS